MFFKPNGDHNSSPCTHVLGLLLVFAFIPFLFSDVFAQNCGNPPTGFGPDWARKYKKWCVDDCCGEFIMSGGNPNCSPGPRWGCKETDLEPIQEDTHKEDAYKKEKAEKEARDKLIQNLKNQNDKKKKQEEAANRLKKSLIQQSAQKQLKDKLRQEAKKNQDEARERLEKTLEQKKEDNATFSLEAYLLVTKLNDAAKEINPSKKIHRSLKCVDFFQALGKQLGAEGEEWTMQPKEKISRANIIADIIAAKALQGKEWTQVYGENQADIARQVQELANRGIVVIGVKKAKNHGHLAIASPIPSQLQLKHFGKAGPMVRDGNLYEGDRTYPKDYGTVRATKAFGSYEKDPPTWYIWLPSAEIKEPITKEPY